MSYSITTTKNIDEVAGFIVSSILAKLNEGKHVLFFATGGSSISVLSRVADFIKEYSCQHLTILLTDERYGTIGHSDSNFSKLIEKGFDIKDAKIIPTLTGDSRDITTKKFIEVLEEEFKKADYKIGLFGIGADGHTAGILPNSIATESKDLACGYDTELFSRITLTFRAIEKLDEVVAFAQGEEKWEVLDDLQKKDIDVKIQPAQILKKVPVLTIFTDYKKV